jgi:group I intron endonuclease
MKSGIYQIVHVATGKRYVGQAKDIAKRWVTHRRSLSRGAHTSRHLQRAWDKYGADAFAFEVVELCEIADLDAREQFHMDQRADFNVLLFARSPIGVVRSDETRRKIADALRGKPKSPEHRAALSRANLGKMQPMEVRRKKSATQKGRPHSPEHRAKLTAKNKARTGYRHSPETIEKIKAAARARSAN